MKKEKKQTVIYTLRVPVELHKEIQQEADNLNLSIASYLRMKMTEMVRNKQK